jgi:hypothetical protein
VKGFDWYVDKVTVHAAHSHGVMWAIPKEMFEPLGGRLTGSLAVSFVPTGSAPGESWEPQPLPALAHAAVYADVKPFGCLRRTGSSSWQSRQTRRSADTTKIRPGDARAMSRVPPIRATQVRGSEDRHYHGRAEAGLGAAGRDV